MAKDMTAREQSNSNSNITSNVQNWYASCLATGKRTTEKKSESQAGIEPTTSITPVRCSNHWATGTPDEPGHLSRFLYSVPLVCRLNNVNVIKCDNAVINDVNGVQCLAMGKRTT